MKWRKRERDFCGAYLSAMDPVRAAEACGCEDGFAMLERPRVRGDLERMRGAAAAELRGMRNAALISAGSDGTDGPTDAAGGYVDGGTFDTLLEKGIHLADALQNNDSYHALEAAGGLIKTGPTGTNVNDVAVALLDCG